MAAVSAPIIPVIGELIRAHPGTLSLGQGVAYYGPPEPVRAAVEAFFDEPEHHRYGPVQGQPELLEHIGRKLQRENGLQVGGEGYRVMVTAGANMAFLNCLLAIADQGEEVILPLPWYFNHEMAIRTIGCRPVGVATDRDFQLDPDRIAAAITPRTRAIVTVSPNNPSGAVYSRERLTAVNELAARHGLFHLSDEAYENFTYAGHAHFSPGSLPGAEAHTVSLYSLSKAYGFASWRIGYAVMPAQVYEAALKVQDTNLICASRIAQSAAVAALEVGAQYCLQRRGLIEVARERVLGALASLGELCRTPRAEGAFYVLPSLETALAPLTLAERLIREHGVAVVPGSAFGLEQGCHLRISYGALESDTMDEALRRLTQGLRALVGPAARG